MRLGDAGASGTGPPQLASPSARRGSVVGVRSHARGSVLLQGDRRGARLAARCARTGRVVGQVWRRRAGRAAVPELCSQVRRERGHGHPGRAAGGEPAPCDEERCVEAASGQHGQRRRQRDATATQVDHRHERPGAMKAEGAPGDEAYLVVGPSVHALAPVPAGLLITGRRAAPREAGTLRPAAPPRRTGALRPAAAGP